MIITVASAPKHVSKGPGLLLYTRYQVLDYQVVAYRKQSPGNSCGMIICKTDYGNAMLPKKIEFQRYPPYCKISVPLAMSTSVPNLKKNEKNNSPRQMLGQDRPEKNSAIFRPIINAMFQSYLSKLFKKENRLKIRSYRRYGEHGEKMFVFLGLFVHAAVRGGTCAFTLKIVNTLITDSSRDDRPSIST